MKTKNLLLKSIPALLFALLPGVVMAAEQAGNHAEIRMVINNGYYTGS